MEKCLCCSHLTTAILVGLWSTAQYLVAFALEVWWIVKIKEGLPFPAYVLALAYGSMGVTSVVMLVGLRLRKTKLLLSWLLLNVVTFCPEAGMVLFMTIYHWSLDTNGLVELGLWVSRVLFDICGMISVQCLYTRWKLEQQTAEIVASSVSYPANTYMIPGGGEFQKKPMNSSNPSLISTGFYNQAFSSAGSFQHGLPHLGELPPFPAPADIRRSRSAVASARSNLQIQRSLSKISLVNYPSRARQNQPVPPILNPLALNHHLDQKYPEMSAFGMDLDAPVFWNSPYSPGGLEDSVSIGSVGRKKGSSGEFKQKKKKTDTDETNNLQWYRPRSLTNLEDDTASIWSGNAARCQEMMSNEHKSRSKSLDRQGDLKSLSLGEINHGFSWEQQETASGKSSGRGGTGAVIALGSRHSVDNYKDVAL